MAYSYILANTQYIYNRAGSNIYAPIITTSILHDHRSLQGWWLLWLTGVQWVIYASVTGNFWETFLVMDCR